MNIAMIVLAVMAAAIGLPIAVYLVYKLFGLVFVILGNLFTFIGAELRDVVKLVGSVIVIPIFSVLVLLNIIIGRWSASAHFGRAVGAECNSFATCIYRLAVGNPARLVGLGGALEGVEQRLPAAMAEAPGRDKPRRGPAGQFEGYTIVGSLPGGGSGAKLYIAEPDPVKRAAFERRGMDDLGRVVIKTFSQADGSTQDRILREGRALEAARELGLVLEHASEEDRFYYVMRYVPGDSLGVVTQRMHAASPGDGLDLKHMRQAMSYVADLVDSLHTYHRGGLWHKDVKPDNIIIDRDDDKAHLVDFGLVTRMSSAMTLTTHGTEYFRDPELVRQALRGAKVQEIDGGKFDVYSSGAVLYAVIENSFPAHGGLSQISKTCPDALRWIVRRAMADYQRRYASAAEMRADLQVVMEASDPYAIKPIDLPSMQGEAAPMPEAPVPEPMPEMPRRAAAGSPVPPAAAVAAAGMPVPPARPEPVGGGRGTPKLRVTKWWTGGYEPMAAGVGVGAAPVSPLVDTPFENAGEKLKTAVAAAKAKFGSEQAEPAVPAAPRTPAVAAGDRAPASEQLKNARERVRQRRAHAKQRTSARSAGRKQAGRARQRSTTAGGMAGMVFGLFLAFAVVFAGLAVVLAFVINPAGPVSSVVVERDGQRTTAESWAFDAEWPEDEHAWPLANMPELDERVLVLSDLGSPLDPKARGSIESMFKQLHDAGASLQGEVVTSVDDTDSDLLDVIARVRTKRGAMPLDSDDFRRKMSDTHAWLDPSYDAVLWLAPVPGSPDEVELVLIGEDGLVRTKAGNTNSIKRLADELADLGL